MSWKPRSGWIFLTQAQLLTHQPNTIIVSSNETALFATLNALTATELDFEHIRVWVLLRVATNFKVLLFICCARISFMLLCHNLIHITHLLPTGLPWKFILSPVQWSLYFKTTHGTKKMWSYIAGGLKIKII